MNIKYLAMLTTKCPQFFHLFYIQSTARLFGNNNGKEEFAQTDGILPIPIISRPVSLRYATIGAFVISEKAIVSFHPLEYLKVLQKERPPGSGGKHRRIQYEGVHFTLWLTVTSQLK